MRADSVITSEKVMNESRLDDYNGYYNREGDEGEQTR